MRGPVVLSAMLVAACASSAAARPSTLSMSCGEAQALVRARGAIVLSTSSTTYDRFVASPGYCLDGEYPDNAYAPTRSGQCRLGYICQPGIAPWDEEDGLFGR